MLNLLTLGLLALLALSAPAVPVQTAKVQSVTVGDPAHPELLASAVQTAYTSGARRITIQPGNYVLSQDGAYFAWDGWKNVTLVARGVTLVQTNSDNGADVFRLTNCDNVSIVGPVITRPEVTHYQGRVMQIGTDVDGKAFCDWKPDTGYPVPPDTLTKFPSALNIADAKTRMLKVGVPDFYGRPMEAQQGDTFRVHFITPTLPFAAGDFVVGRYKIGGAFKIFLKDSTHCTVQDCTFLRNGFASVREAGGGSNCFLHCAWRTGPRPEGATEDSLVASASDGLHSTGANPGPDIERCTFQGVMLDDCFAIHGSFYAVKSVVGRALTLDGAAPLLAAGEPVRMSDAQGFYAEAVAAAVVHNADGTTTLTLNKDIAVPVGAKVSNPMRAGAGYKILNCQLGGTRSRGILAKADNGLIQNNTIVGCGQAAVSVGPEYYWNEADYVHNVQIVGNTITNCGFIGYGGAAVWVHGDGAMGNAGVVVKNNTFQSNYAGGVQVEWTQGATLTANTFAGAATRPPSLPVRSPILLTHCRTVGLSGNAVQTPALYPPVLVSVGADVEGVTHNDASGIAVAVR